MKFLPISKVAVQEDICKRVCEEVSGDYLSKVLTDFQRLARLADVRVICLGFPQGKSCDLQTESKQHPEVF